MSISSRKNVAVSFWYKVFQTVSAMVIVAMLGMILNTVKELIPLPEKQKASDIRIEDHEVRIDAIERQHAKERLRDSLLLEVRKDSVFLKVNANEVGYKWLGGIYQWY